VRGFVTNEEGDPLHAAKLRIAGRKNHFYTTTLGEFWRILLDGNYVLEVRTFLTSLITEISCLAVS
jgi:hypothetical protein